MGDFLEFERRFWNATWVAKDVLMQFHLPEYAENETLRLLNKTMRKGATNGRSLEKTTACLLYYVVKEYDLPFTAYEIAGEFEFGKHELLKTHRKLRGKLNLEEQSLDPGCLVEKYAEKLELEPMDEFRARKKLKEFNGKLSGRDPRSKVALALYETSNRSRREISEVLDITKRSISRLRSRVRE